MHKKTIRFVLILLVIPFLNMAQERFQRIYEADDNIKNGGIVQNSTGAYYVFNSIDRNTDSTIANVTHLDPKGDMIWSRNYHFRGRQWNFAETSIALLEKDTFAFSIVQNKDSLNVLVATVSPQGDILWSKAYGLNNSDSFNGSAFDAPILLKRPNNGIALFTSFVDPNSNLTRPYFAFLDSEGSIEAASLLQRDTLFELITDAKRTPDNGYILSGLSVVQQQQGFLIKLDSLGQVQWSKYYSHPETCRIAGVEPTDSNSYIIIGDLGDSSPSFGPRSFIGHVDSIGAPYWINRVDTNDSYVYKLLRLENGNFLATGLIQSSLDSWNMEFSTDGTVLWEKSYFLDGFPFPYGAYATKDGGSVQSYRVPSANIPGGFSTHIVKVNTAGESSCEVDLSTIFISDSLQTDTAIWTLDQQTEIEDRFPTSNLYSGFNLPTLTLEPPTPFCEGEPIQVEFDATVPGATSYTWGGEAEGQTGPIITATALGMYTVDVRIDTMVCFNLCDTVFITDTGPPSVSIAQVGDVCADGSSFLLANTEGFVSDYNWSTGADTPLTPITELGTYSITVSNDCGTGFADTTLTNQLTASILQSGDLCAGGADTLSLMIDGTATAFNWSTGEEEELIEVFSEGIYSVLVSNFCNEATAEIEIDCVFDIEVCVGVPNAFTPDNDGDNDTFNVIIAPECTFGVAIGKIEIWNRWGELVYESETGQDWDGTQNGQEAASDVYLYRIEVETIDEESAILKGGLTLIR